MDNIFERQNFLKNKKADGGNRYLFRVVEYETSGEEKKEKILTTFTEIDLIDNNSFNFQRILDSGSTQLDVRINKTFDFDANLPRFRMLEIWEQDYESLKQFKIFSGYLMAKSVSWDTDANNRKPITTLMASGSLNCLVDVYAKKEEKHLIFDEIDKKVFDLLEHYIDEGNKAIFGTSKKTIGAEVFKKRFSGLCFDIKNHLNNEAFKKYNKIITLKINNNNIQEVINDIIKAGSINLDYYTDTDRVLHIWSKIPEENKKEDIRIFPFTFGKYANRIEITQDISNIKNRITVIHGSSDVDGVAIEENAESIEKYGVKEEVITDSNIGSTEVAKILAKRILKQKSEPITAIKIDLGYGGNFAPYTNSEGVYLDVGDIHPGDFIQVDGLGDASVGAYNPAEGIVSVVRQVKRVDYSSSGIVIITDITSLDPDAGLVLSEYIEKVKKKRLIAKKGGGGDIKDLKNVHYRKFNHLDQFDKFNKTILKEGNLMIDYDNLTEEVYRVYDFDGLDIWNKIPEEKKEKLKGSFFLFGNQLISFWLAGKTQAQNETIGVNKIMSGIVGENDYYRSYLTKGLIFVPTLVNQNIQAQNETIGVNKIMSGIVGENDYYRSYLTKGLIFVPTLVSLEIDI